MQDGSSERSGRRSVPEGEPRTVYEHYHRYAVASRYARGKRVLDLGCGEGHGSALLAAEADEVVGVDDADAVERARAEHSGRRLEFHAGSVTDPELLARDGCFDVVVCFHVLEQLDDHETLLEVVRSRLAPGGLVLVSTPDLASARVAASARGTAADAAARLTAPEFGSLLEGAFRHVAVLQQNLAAGSLVVPSEPGDPDTAIEGVRLQTVQRTAAGWQVRQGVPHTELIGFASDRQLPRLPAAAVLLDQDLTLARDDADEDAQQRARRVEQGRHEAEQRARESEQRAQRAEEQVQWLRDAAARLEGRAAEAQSRVAELTAQDADRRQRSALAQQGVDRVAPSGTRRRGLLDGVLRHLSSAEQADAAGGSGGLGTDSGSGAEPTGAEDGPVDVPRARNPQVSVILPARGGWARTRERLRLLAGHVVSVPFEVIAVVDTASGDTVSDAAASDAAASDAESDAAASGDAAGSAISAAASDGAPGDAATSDAASDEVVRRLAECGGVRTVRSERCLRITGAGDLGAEHARGELLLFLTGDVTESWLDGLVDVLRSDGSIGLVGAKLVAPDGRLRQAGGAVFSDGTAHSPGAGVDGDDPVSEVLRDVDYCSASALLVRAELFDRLGGFDTRLATSDYAAADLAFAARAAGSRTAVQPRAVVVQPDDGGDGAGAQESGAGGGRAADVEHDRAAFVDKWADTLEREHLATSEPGSPWLARQRGTLGHHGPVVLVADECVPRSDTEAGARRMRGLLEQLREFGCRVVFFPTDHGEPEPWTSELRRLGVIVLPRAASQQAFLRQAGAEIELAVLSGPRAAWTLLEQLRTSATGAVVVHDAVEPAFLGLRRRAELMADLGDADAASALHRRCAAARERELAAVRAADAVLVTGAAHRRTLGDIVPEARIHVLSPVVNPEPVASGPVDRQEVLLAGTFADESVVDSAQWSVEQIMPLVWRRCPQARLHVVGTDSAGGVRELERPGVAVHERVDDLARWYARTRTTLAPLRFGTGAAEAVGESLARGVPVVGTSIAPEGLRLGDGDGIRVGRTPEELAEATARLLTDDGEWRDLSRAGRAAVAEQCGPEAGRAAVRGLLELGKINLDG